MLIACTSPKIVVFWPHLKSEFKNQSHRRQVSSLGYFLFSIDLIKLHRWEHGMKKKNFGLPFNGLRLVCLLAVSLIVIPKLVCLQCQTGFALEPSWFTNWGRAFFGYCPSLPIIDLKNSSTQHINGIADISNFSDITRLCTFYQIN